MTDRNESVILIGYNWLDGRKLAFRLEVHKSIVPGARHWRTPEWKFEKTGDD